MHHGTRDITAFVFVVNLCSYAQLDHAHHDSNPTSRLGTAIASYNDAIAPYLRHNHDADNILILTGADELPRTLGRVPLSTVFPEYQGDNGAGPASDFIQSLFRQDPRRPDDAGKVRPVHVDSDDRSLVPRIVAAVNETVLEKRVLEKGMV